MDIILDYIASYKEVFLKDNTDKIKTLDRLIKKFKIKNKASDWIRIIINERPYECRISTKSGKITKSSIGIFTNYHINGILLFYSMLGSIAFLTEDFKANCSILRILTLLTGDVKSGQELLLFLQDKENNITPFFFAEYLYYCHDVLLINRLNFEGISLDAIENKYKKDYSSNDEEIINFINALSKRKITSKILVCNLNSKFYEDISDNLISLSKVFVGNIISPLSNNIDQPTYYYTWYLLDSERIKIKNNKLVFEDFLFHV